MMRRARWLAAGAVLGALGYQRLHRAARSQARRLDQAPAAQQAASAVIDAASAAARTAGHLADAAGWLARQVRARRAAERRSLGGAGRFIDDVRAGMDDYLDRHQANIDRQYRRSGNSLITQHAPERAALPGGPGLTAEIGPGTGSSRVSHPRAGASGRQRQDHKTKDGR
jgi:hypothetical protein